MFENREPAPESVVLAAPPAWLAEHWAAQDADPHWVPAGAPEPSPTHADLLAAVESGASGLRIAGLLERLSHDDLTADDELIERMQAWSRVVAHAQAGLLAEIAELARWRDDDPTFTTRDTLAYLEFMPVEIGLALKTGPRAAEGLVEVALALRRRLPATAAALAAGTIDLPTARAIVQETALIKDLDVLARVEAAALGKAEKDSGTARAVRMFTRREAAKAEPDLSAEREAAAAEDVGVTRNEIVDGVGDLTVTLAARDRCAVWTALNDRARELRALPGETRTLSQLRAAVLVDLVTRPCHGAAAEPARSHPWKVDVIVNLTTLLGLDQDPAVLVGQGLISATAAREFAADAVWRRLVTDPLTGRVIERSKERYRPSSALSDYVDARDQHCATPGCRRPAAECEKDHRTAFDEGGPTCACNLWPLCKHHHRCKHSPGWTFRREADGSTTVTTPTGHTYSSDPPTPWD